MRVCYLRTSHSINGATSLTGRGIVSQIRSERDMDLTVSHLVMQDAGGSDPDVMSPHQFEVGGFDVVLVEGGFVDLAGRARVPLEVAESYISGGGVLVVMDVDLNEVQRTPAFYQSAGRLFGAAPSTGSAGPRFRYGADQVSFYQHPPVVRCLAQTMAVATRHQDSLHGIDHVLAAWPVELQIGTAEIVASANPTSDVLCDDVFEDRGVAFPWATANLVGGGFAILLAAGVSHDVWTTENPDNARWIINLSRYFVDEVARERELVGRPSHISEMVDINRLDRALWERVEGHLNLTEEQQSDVIKWSAANQDNLERSLRNLIEQRLVARYGYSDAVSRTRQAVRAEVRDAFADDVNLTEALEQTYWLDLKAIVSRNWPLFESVFASDKRKFTADMDEMNLRMHAHPKKRTMSDVYRVFDACQRLTRQLSIA